MEATSPWPNLTLIISQRLHFQIPSPWGLKLQHMNLGGMVVHKLSVRRTHLVTSGADLSQVSTTRQPLQWGQGEGTEGTRIHALCGKTDSDKKGLSQACSVPSPSERNFSSAPAGYKRGQGNTRRGPPMGSFKWNFLHMRPEKKDVPLNTCNLLHVSSQKILHSYLSVASLPS